MAVSVVGALGGIDTTNAWQKKGSISLKIHRKEVLMSLISSLIRKRSFVEDVIS